MGDDDRSEADPTALVEALGIDVDAKDASQSDLLNLLVRYAIPDVDAELIEDRREARQERAMEKADEGL